tara:strand:+ start:38579 stop:38770 length:192 start_codon:yes stop_codon:yes gene_type:complete
MDFNEHYNIHWDFFKNVNKEADEEFFINLHLRKYRNKIDKEDDYRLGLETGMHFVSENRDLFE